MVKNGHGNLYMLPISSPDAYMAKGRRSKPILCAALRMFVDAYNGDTYLPQRLTFFDDERKNFVASGPNR